MIIIHTYLYLYLSVHSHMLTYIPSISFQTGFVVIAFMNVGPCK